MKIKCDIAAKINLSLKITGKIGGMHTLDSTVCSINLYDTAIILPRSDGKFNVNSESQIANFQPERFDKLIYAAADKFKCKYGALIQKDFGADINIIKRIPLGAGLGGSSASVAGAILGLCALLNLQAKEVGKASEVLRLDDRFLLSLGSDVPFMSKGGRARLTGIGGKIEILPFKKQHFVIIVPDSGVDSGEAYKLYDKLQESGAVLKPIKTTAENTRFKATQNFENNCTMHEATLNTESLISKTGAKNMSYGSEKVLSVNIGMNDLKEVAFILNPDALKAHSALLSMGAERVLFSGSGSASAAVFCRKSDAQKFFAKFDANQNGYIAQTVYKREAVRITIC